MHGAEKRQTMPMRKIKFCKIIMQKKVECSYIFVGVGTVKSEYYVISRRVSELGAMIRGPSNTSTCVVYFLVHGLFCTVLILPFNHPQFKGV